MADPITAVIAAVVKIGSAIVAAYKASALARLAIHAAAMLAAAFLSTAFASKPGKIDQGQELSLKLDPTMPRQVAVGRVATGGSQAWGFTYGSTKDVPNRYMVRIIALSDRPAKGCVRVFDGTSVLNFIGDINTGLRPCSTYHGKSGEYRMWVQVVPGSDTPTGNEASWLFSASGGRWTSNHKYVGGCYAIVQYDYDPDAFPNGEPNLVFELDGASAYDDRESVAEGGTQDPALPSTWDFSRNAAAITHQILRGYYTNDTLIVGAQAAETDFYVPDNIAALNTCDQIVNLNGGGSVPRYRAGMMLTAAESTSSMLEDMKNAMDGEVIDRNGKLCVLPGAIRTPVFHLTDEDIDWSAEKSYQPRSTLSSLYNQVTGTFVPAALYYAEASFPVQRDPAFVAEDGGQLITLTQSFRAVNDDNQIQRITVRILKSSRFQKIVAFTGPLWLYEAQKGDWFALSSTRWNLSTKYFEVDQVTLGQDLRVTIIGLETSATIDGWDPAEETPRTSQDYVPPEYHIGVPEIVLTPITVIRVPDTEDPTPPDPIPPGDITEIPWDEESYEVPANYTKLPGVAIELIQPAGTPAMAFRVQYRQLMNPDDIQDLPMIALGSDYVEYPNDQRSSTKASPDALFLANTRYQFRAQATDGLASSEWSDWETVTTFPEHSVPDAGGIGGYPYPLIFAWMAKTAKDAKQALEEIAAIGEALGDDVLEKIEEFLDRLPEFELVLDNQPDWARTILDLVQRSTDIEDWIKGIAFPEGVPVGTAHIHEVTARQEGDATIVESVDQLSVVVGDNAAYVGEQIDIIVDDLGAEINARELLAIQTSNSFAGVQYDINLVATDLSSEVSARESFQVSTGNNFAAVNNSIDLVADDLGVEVSLRQALAASTANSFLGVNNSISALVTDTDLLFDQTTEIYGRVGAAEGAIITNRSLSISELAAEASAREALGVTVGNNAAYFAGEISTLATNLGAEVTARQALGVTVGNNYTSLTTSINLVASDLAVEANKLTTLTGRVGTAEGLIASETILRVNADDVFTQNFNLLGGRRGDNAAWIMNEATVQVGVRGSMASVIDGLVSTDGTLTSQYSSLASVSAGHALAITALQTETAGYTTSITQLFEITDDLVLRAALALNNNGIITGYEIDGIAGSFIVAANYFGIAAESGGTTYYPLAVTGTGVQIATTLYIGGANFYMNPATQTLVSISGGQRTMFGGPFGATGNVVLWSGSNSIPLGSETWDNGMLGIIPGDGFFGGKVLNGPFDSGLQSGAFSVTGSWQTIAQVSNFATRPGRMSLYITIQTSGSGTVVSSEPGLTLYGLSCDWRIVSTNTSGGDLEELLTGTAYRSQMNNPSFGWGGGGRSPTSFNDRQTTAKTGVRNFLLQVKLGAFGATLAVDQRQFNGDYYTTS